MFSRLRKFGNQVRCLLPTPHSANATLLARGVNACCFWTRRWARWWR